MNTSTATPMDLDSLLDTKLDDLEDLPSYGVYPNGAHQVTISFEAKKVNDHPCVELQMVAISTLELSDPATDTPLKAGSAGSVLYMLDNEIGTGKLKELMQPLKEFLNTSSIRETMEAAKSLDVIVVTKIRMNKEKTQSYNDVVKLSVV